MKKICIFTLVIFFLFFFKSFANDNFLSLKKTKVNVRYGPGFNYPIKYIYKKINLPIKIIDKKKILEELLIKKIIVAGYIPHN